MEKQKAKKILLEEGRFNLKPKSAEEICKAFGVEFDKSLIRTSLGYRECIKDPTEPRVSVCNLSEHICKKLKKEPDAKTLKTANVMCGEGSHRDLYSKAYAMNL